MKGYHSSVLLKEAVGELIPARFRQDGLATAGGGNLVFYFPLCDGGDALGVF